MKSLILQLHYNAAVNNSNGTTNQRWLRMLITFGIMIKIRMYAQTV